MPAAQTQTTEAQARFVVSLPSEVGKQIDKLAERIADQTRESLGVGISPSRAQVVQALVQDALKRGNGDQE
jgi:metal-responsive CopG/Arc/MetJ family transcriptional regulator